MSAGRRAALNLWDFLVWLTVLFPLFLGGIWISRPGLKLELTQLALPCLVLGVFAIALDYSGVRLKEATSLRFLSRLWQRWNHFYFKDERKALLSGFLLVATVYALSSLRRHWAFGSGAADLGIFTSAIWNLTHGNGYHSSLKDGMHLLADHQSPIFFLFAPLFLLWPRPELLLIAQAFILSAGVFALLGIAKQYLPSRHWALAVLPLLYWSYQPVRNANAFDFHPETTLLPLFLCSIWLLQSASNKRRLLGVLVLLLSLATKESAGPVLTGISLVWLLGGAPDTERRRLQIWAIPLMLLGVFVFIFDLKFVPVYFGGSYIYSSSFSHLGGNLQEILLSPIFNARVFWQEQLFGPARLRFLFDSFAPLAFLPLLAPRYLLAALPGFLMLFLGEGSHRVTTGYHYILEPAVGIFWALILAFKLFSAADKKIFFSRVSIATWLAFAAFAMFGRSEIWSMRYFSATPHQAWVRTQALPALDPTATIAASGALVPHIATRFWAHHLPKTARPTGDALDCILLEDSVNNWPLQDAEKEPFAKALEQGFVQEYSCGGFKIYRLKERPSACLSSALTNCIQ